MVTLVRKEYQGGALQTTLNGGIDNAVTSCTLISGSTFPNGASYPFVLEFDRGTSSAEKVLCTTRSGNNVTGMTRGYDGTTAVLHNSGASVSHVLDATTLTHLWEHISDTSRDDHTQYLNTTRHDVTARHTIGTVIPAGTTPLATSTSAAVGSANTVARGDHVHTIGVGSINASNQFAAGVVDSTALASAAVTAGKIAAGGISASNQFAAGVVDSTALAAAAVTAGKIANGGISNQNQFAAGIYSSVFTGIVMPFAGKTAPTNTLLCDGSAVSRATYANLFAVIAPTVGTFTVTIASPAVVSLNGHGLQTGDSVYLTTSGALPTGLSSNTLYYVIRVDANSFNLATSRANAYSATKINTSGTQSGTHTLNDCPWGLGDGSTTFNIPDMRGYAPAGSDSIGGTVASRLTKAQTQGVYGNRGATGGEQGHQLVTAELASHTHQENFPQTNNAGSENNPGSYFGQMIYTNNASHTSQFDGSAMTTNATGSDTAHNVVQPTAVLNYIIFT